MVCKNCPMAGACRIIEAINNFSTYADITISRCNIKEGFNSREQTHSVQPTQVNVLDKPVRDFTNVSNANKKIELSERKEKIKTPLTIIPVEVKAEKISCPTCKGLTTDDDLTVCSNCGKTVCSNCGTQDPETHAIKCEKCW